MKIRAGYEISYDCPLGQGSWLAASPVIAGLGRAFGARICIASDGGAPHARFSGLHRPVLS
jgi:hypothetical protein